MPIITPFRISKGGGVAVPVVYPGWDAADHHASYAISGDNSEFLDALGTIPVDYTSAARGETSHVTTGKFVFAVQIISGGATDYGVGLMTTAHSLSFYVGQLTTSWGMFRSGNVYTNSSAIKTYTGADANGEIVMVAWDAAAQKMWFGANGTWNGDPGAGTDDIGVAVTGTLKPAATLISDTQQLKYLGTPDSYPYTVPTGFTTWEA